MSQGALRVDPSRLPESIPAQDGGDGPLGTFFASAELRLIVQTGGRELSPDETKTAKVELAVNPPTKGLFERLKQHQDLTELKRILRHGTNEPDGQPIRPFQFRGASGEVLLTAEAAGLEGFVFSERKFSERFGAPTSQALLGNYFHYTLSLLNGAAKTQEPRQMIEGIRDSHGTPEQRYTDFIAYIRAYVGGLQSKVAKLDQANWSLSTRMYHVFVRAFNLDGWRAAHGVPIGEQSRESAPNRASAPFFQRVSGEDLRAIRELSFDAVRYMGTFPIGKVGAKGTGGGSPFAAQRFSIDAAHGTRKDAANHLRLAADHGVRGVFELVLNHTAIDSDLVRHNPKLFVHTRIPPRDPSQYFKVGDYWIRFGGHIDEGTGQRAYFRDTLQLDLSNQETRDLLIAQTKDLVRDNGVQGFRVDMAYKLRNAMFRECWGRELANPERGQREFLEELLTAVKVSFPGVAFIAEAFAGWDELSADGFDLIYGLDDMVLRGGGRHHGWHHALASRDPERIRNAIQRAEFLHWQSGGADMITFWGQHDKPGFWRLFGEQWKYGAALLTLMRPGALSVFASSEAEFEAPCEEDLKVITFNKPVAIDWTGTQDDFGKFQRTLLRQFRELELAWGKLTFELLPTPHGESWVGYIVRPLRGTATQPSLLVITNPTDAPTSVTVESEQLEISGITFTLPRCGPNGNKLVWLRG
jgi:hypothetical protein